ncbi:MAG: prephenate dehydrogenase/arogenate dehydrogenase family protein [Chloroflexi bacterium]|nr:prephenate dehydrogenase/arogenate dehydrogenase family protein [Chloroflexota bacterium]
MNVKRISIIGLGLIGGSLGLALKQSMGTNVEIVGFARRPEVAKEAVRIAAVDKTAAQLVQAVRDANIVIIATPVLAMKDILQEIAGHLSPNTIVTDVGSTKAQVLKWATEYLPPTVAFIGGHPMCGKETSGIDEAEAGLFKDCVYCLTQDSNSSKEALAQMEDIVNAVGARSVVLDAEMHDQLVAGISHLPLLLSSTLVSTLSKSLLWPEMSKLAATGFLDMTRLASGDPELYRGICMTNQHAISDWIDKYIDALREYQRTVMADDHELQKTLQEAREVRKKWLDNEGYRYKK